MDWPAAYVGLKRLVPFETSPDQPFLTTAHGTPLWHVEIRDDALILHRKIDGGPLPIPQVTLDHFPLAAEHRRLACDACHAQWAPQCYGCHLAYDPDAEQWDHVSRTVTPGAWQESRWELRSDMAPLGVHADGTIRVFVPGMIMTLAHPNRPAPLFVRRFATLSPHTTGPAHGCNDCHSNPVAMGLGQGLLSIEGKGLRFLPRHEPLGDGLPPDAWTDLSVVGGGQGDGSRPFSSAEIERIWTVPIGPR